MTEINKKLQDEINQWLADHCPELTASVSSAVVVFTESKQVKFHAPRAVFDFTHTVAYGCSAVVGAYSGGKIRGVNMAIEQMNQVVKGERPIDSLLAEDRAKKLSTDLDMTRTKPAESPSYDDSVNRALGH